MVCSSIQEKKVIVYVECKVVEEPGVKSNELLKPVMSQIKTFREGKNLTLVLALDIFFCNVL